MKRSRLPASLLAAALVAGCAGLHPVERHPSSGRGWPPEDPRVRLESVIELSPRARGRSSVLEWLGETDGGPGFRRPYGVTWDGEDLVVVDPGTRRVARIPARGKVRFSPAGLFAQPIGIAACPAGIVVSDSAAGSVALLDDRLRLVRWLGEDLNRPTGLACDADTIFVVETGSHRVVAFDPAGRRTHLGRRGDDPGRFNFPTSVAIGGGGLLVGDAMNFRVQRVDPGTGRSLGAFGELGDAPGQMPRIKGVAADRIGNIWVTDAHLDRVSLYDLEGNLLVSIGGAGEADGEFSFPAGVAAHADGRVAVVDSLNQRLQIFRILAVEPWPEAVPR